ncbi:MAG: recombination regulator RecX [Bdellovibrionales bacterium]|nr:recombination regulator RecX [Bdellovibrionales bacterium]
MENEKEEKRYVRRSAYNKVMDYLALRDHSEHELIQKLKRAKYTPEEIATAMEKVVGSSWMPKPEVMAQKVANSLHRKRKSYLYIMQYLKQKKLPMVPRDADIEEEKARSLAEGRFSDLSNLSQLDKKKVARFLQSRGFDFETINRVTRIRS